MLSILKPRHAGLLALVFLLAQVAHGPLFGGRSRTGILLLAHGGSDAWDATVRELAASLKSGRPLEIAFGMADESSMQAGVDRLEAAGVTRIVAVPHEAGPLGPLRIKARVSLAGAARREEARR